MYIVILIVFRYLSDILYTFLLCFLDASFLYIYGKYELLKTTPEIVMLFEQTVIPVMYLTASCALIHFALSNVFLWPYSLNV